MPFKTPFYLLLALGGSLLALLAFNLVQKQAHEFLHASFVQRAEQFEQSLQGRIDQELGIIDALSGFFLASDTVEQDEYSLFASRLLKDYPEVVLLSWWRVEFASPGERPLVAPQFIQGDPATIMEMGHGLLFNGVIENVIEQSLARRRVVSAILPASSGDGASGRLAVAYPVARRAKSEPFGVSLALIRLDEFFAQGAMGNIGRGLRIDSGTGALRGAEAAPAEAFELYLFHAALHWPGVTVPISIRATAEFRHAEEFRPETLHDVLAWVVLFLGVALSVGAALLLRGLGIRNERLAERNAQLQVQREMIERAHREWTDAFDAIPYPIFLHDREYRLMQANKAYVELAGCSVDDVVGRYYWELFPRGDGPTPACREGLHELGAAHEEMALDGRDYDCFYYAVTDESGTFRYSIHVMEDVTARKQAETGLVEEKTRAQCYLNIANVVMLALDRDGRITLINRKGCEVLGYEESALLGRDWFDCCIEPADRAAVRGIFGRGVQGAGMPEYFENPVVTAKGEKRTIAWHNSALRDPSGKVTGLLSSGEDITEKRKLEEALRISAERLDRAMSATSDGLWDWDIRGNSVYYSQRWKGLLGYEEDEIKPEFDEWRSRIHPDDLPVAEEALRRHMAGETEQLVIEFRMRHKDGHWVWILDRGQVQRDDSGEPVRMTGTHIDITQRRAMEDEMTRLLSALGERVKEQRCLYDISRLTADLERPLDEVFQAVVERLPAAFQDPASIAVRIAHGGRIYQTANFRPVAVSLVQDFRLNGKTEGSLTVVDLRPQEAGSRDLLLLEETQLLESVADRIESMLEMRAHRAALVRINRALRTLSQTNRTLIHATSVPGLVADISRVMVESASYVSVWLALTDGEGFEVLSALGPCDTFADNIGMRWREEADFRARIQDVVTNNAAHQRLLTGHDLDLLCAELCKTGSINTLMLPVSSGERVLGVMGVYSLDRDAFALDELELLQELAGDTAYGIISLRTLDERNYARGALDTVLFQTIEAIGLTVEKRDPYTAGHQERVAQLAVAIGRLMGLDEERLTGLHLGAVIHDIGKISVPSEILNSPGKLSKFEFGLIRSHPQVGYDIIKGVDFPWPVSQMIYQHHERLDGSGYPNGLKGDEIILEAKILAVADVVEAISSHRPYRPALGIEVGIREIKAGRGTLFEPAVVDSCLALFEHGGFEWRV